MKGQEVKNSVRLFKLTCVRCGELTLMDNMIFSRKMGYYFCLDCMALMRNKPVVMKAIQNALNEQPES